MISVKTRFICVDHMFLISAFFIGYVEIKFAGGTLYEKYYYFVLNIRLPNQTGQITESHVGARSLQSSHCTIYSVSPTKVAERCTRHSQKR